MNDKRQADPAPGMTLGDIYFVLFRHKWAIVLFSLAGLAAAAAIHATKHTLYQSKASLLIKYVVDDMKQGPTETANDPGMKMPGSQDVINSEVQILTSWDVAKEVADQVAVVMGPESILAEAGGGTNSDAAAAFIKANLNVDLPQKSGVIEITFQHPDPRMVQPVLTNIINSYFK